MSWYDVEQARSVEVVGLRSSYDAKDVELVLNLYPSLMDWLWLYSHRHSFSLFTEVRLFVDNLAVSLRLIVVW